MNHKFIHIFLGVIISVFIVFAIESLNSDRELNKLKCTLYELSTNISNGLNSSRGVRVVFKDSINNYYTLTQKINISQAYGTDFIESKCNEIMNGLRSSGYYKIPNNNMLYTYKSEYEIFFNVHYDYVEITMTNIINYK